MHMKRAAALSISINTSFVVRLNTPMLSAILPVPCQGRETNSGANLGRSQILTCDSSMHHRSALLFNCEQ